MRDQGIEQTLDLPMQVAKAFARDMRAYFAEKNAIKRDEIAGHAEFLLEPYQSPRQRRLRLPDIYARFEQMKDHAQNS